MILPGVVEQLADEDRGNSMKLLGLLSVLLLGCYFWIRVWQREHSEALMAQNVVTHFQGVGVASANVTQQSGTSVAPQRSFLSGWR